MTTLNDLVQLVEEYPDSELFALMLVEYLVCDCDRVHSEAVRHVANIRDPLLAARRIAAGTELLADGSASRAHLVGRLMQRTMIPLNARPTIVVIDGGHVTVQPPTGNHDTMDRYWGTTVIAVGADWLRDEWSAELTARANRRATLSARRRRR